MSNKSPPEKSPAKPAKAPDELSEKQLDQAAGGWRQQPRIPGIPPTGT